MESPCTVNVVLFHMVIILVIDDLKLSQSCPFVKRASVFGTRVYVGLNTCPYNVSCKQLQNDASMSWFGQRATCKSYSTPQIHVTHEIIGFDCFSESSIGFGL